MIHLDDEVPNLFDFLLERSNLLVVCVKNCWKFSSDSFQAVEFQILPPDLPIQQTIFLSKFLQIWFQKCQIVPVVPPFPVRKLLRGATNIVPSVKVCDFICGIYWNVGGNPAAAAAAALPGKFLMNQVSNLDHVNHVCVCYLENRSDDNFRPSRTFSIKGQILAYIPSKVEVSCSHVIVTRPEIKRSYNGNTLA